MKPSEIFHQWLHSSSKRLLMGQFHVTEWTKEIELKIYHSAMLAVDLVRLDNATPARIQILGQSPVSEWLKSKIEDRGISIEALAPSSGCPKDSTEVSFEMDLEISWKWEQEDCLFISVSGTYPDGSNGDGTAHAIYRILAFLTDWCEPQALLLDLRKLDYKWGDELRIRPPKFMFVDSRFALLLEKNQLTYFSFLEIDSRTATSLDEAREILGLESH